MIRASRATGSISHVKRRCISANEINWLISRKARNSSGAANGQLQEVRVDEGAPDGHDEHFCSRARPRNALQSLLVGHNVAPTLKTRQHGAYALDSR